MSTWYPEADLVIQHPKIYTVAITCDEVKEGKTDFPIIEDGGVAAKDGKVIAVGTAADVQQFTPRSSTRPARSSRPASSSATCTASGPASRCSTSTSTA